MSAIRKTDEVAETAALYAVGKLGEEEARRFEQRIQSGCPYCMAELEGCQRAIEELVLAAPPAPPAPGLEAKLLERIGLISRSPQPAAHEPKIVRQDEGDWVDGPHPGVKLRFLHRKRTMLVKMEPGSTYPTHAHALDEQCLVLEGSIRDGEGRTAAAGDYIFMPKGSTHPPLSTETGALFLIAYT